MGLLSLLGGCNDNNGLNTQIETAAQPTLAASSGENSNISNSLSIQFSKASLISQEGMEVEVDPSLFQEKWDLFTDFADDSKPSSFENMYTVVAWDKLNQPYVIQVSKKELKVGHYYYSGERISQFIVWMKQYIGEQYLNSLTMDRMTLQANDIGIKSQIPDEKSQEIYQLIKTASLVKGEPRIMTPLFPYYQLIVEYSGKDFLNVYALSPTLISLDDGTDRWYFQLNSSIFSFITPVIPVTEYSKRHIKHLFNAEELNINEPELSINLSAHFNDTLKEKAAIQQISRILTTGKKVTEEDVGEVKQRLQFTFSDASFTQINVYEDHFQFNNELHFLKGVTDKIDLVLEFEKN